MNATLRGNNVIGGGGEEWRVLSNSQQSRRSRLRFWKLRMSDVLVVSAVWAGILVGTNITTVASRSNGQGLAFTLVVALATGLSLQRADMYTEPTIPRTDEIAALTRSVLIGAALMAVASAFTDWQLGAWEIGIGSVVAITSLILSRGVHRSLRDRIPNHSLARVVIVGTGHEAQEVALLIADHPESSLELVGVIGDLSLAQTHGLAASWLGPSDQIVELMHRHCASAAVVTPTDFSAQQFNRVSQTLFANGYDVYLSTGVTRNHLGSYDIRSLAHEPLVVMTRHTAPNWTYPIKRAMDLVGATIALILTSPIFLLTALAIKIEDRGPVFFVQNRAGKNAEWFGMLKFRSMVMNAEDLKDDLAEANQRTGPLFKVSGDPRATRVGRIIRDLSIDELPQLINVLRGDMSLVGPRPALEAEEAAFEGELRRRFSIRPGISGLWQVEARSNANFRAYHRLDLHYVENWSLGLDLRILMATAAQVVESIFLLPLKPLIGSGPDSIAVPEHNLILDLRDPVSDFAEPHLEPGFGDRPIITNSQPGLRH